MDRFKISVIVPIYNAEKTIKKCITSVIEQTLDDIELILVDDGSSDLSSGIIDSFRGYQNVKVLHKKNEGVSAARNNGINMSEAKYLFFLDSDDYLEEDVLEKMWRFGEDNELDLVSCAHTEYNATLYSGNDSDKNSFIAKNAKEIGEHFNEIFPKSACAKLFKTSLIKSFHIRFPEKMCLGEDLYFTYSFLLIANCVGKVGNVFYRIQNVNPLSLSKRFVSSYETDIIQQIDLWRQLIRKYPSVEDSYYKENMDMELNLTAGYFNNLYKQDCEFTKKEKYQQIKQFLNRHKEWIKGGGKGIKRPKNKLQKITLIVVKSQNPRLIGAFFCIKEAVKKRKFEGGKNALI